MGEPLVLQVQQKGPTGESHSMSAAQHALSAGSEGGGLCAGTFKGGGKCCSWAGRRARISLGWDWVWVQSVLQRYRHTSVFGNSECVTKGRTRVPVAVECRLTFTCCILFYRKMQRCIREALVRICTPLSTSHMASLTELSGTTFQVKDTLNLLHCLSSS